MIRFALSPDAARVPPPQEGGKMPSSVAQPADSGADSSHKTRDRSAVSNDAVEAFRDLANCEADNTKRKETFYFCEFCEHKEGNARSAKVRQRRG
jgi:hypothetical protein